MNELNSKPKMKSVPAMPFVLRSSKEGSTDKNLIN
jgi:hypothetical protein